MNKLIKWLKYNCQINERELTQMDYYEYCRRKKDGTLPPVPLLRLLMVWSFLLSLVALPVLIFITIVVVAIKDAMGK
jgi:hypothetical protein